MSCTVCLACAVNDDAVPVTGAVAHPAEWLVIAAVVVVVLTGVAILLFKTREGFGGLVTGKDGRISTSRTVVYLWTAIVAWMVASEALVAIFADPTLDKAAASFGQWLTHAFDDAPSRELYLVLLGGPYLAAVMSGVIVQTRVNNQTLQKTPAGRTSVIDAVPDDSGSVDPVDFQYVLFNLLVALAVALSFAANVGDGLPEVTEFLAILTGGSALTYTLNKGATSNAPALTALHPQTARVGEKVTAYGNNLALVTAQTDDKGPLKEPPKPKATVAGVDATVTNHTTDSVSVVPAPAPGTTSTPDDRQRVVVTTVAGLTAFLDDLRVVLDEPVPQRLEPTRIAVASTDDYAQLPITIHGQLLAGPSGSEAKTQVELVAAGGTPVTVSTTAAGETLRFTLPATIAAPGALATLSIDVNVVRGAARGKEPLTLTVEAVAAPVLARLDVDVVEADAGAALEDVEITATGSHLQAAGRTIQAQLTDAAGVASEPVAVTSVDDTTVTFKLPPGTQAPDLSPDDTRQVVLKLGTLVSSAQPLILRGRADPTIDTLTPNPLDVPAGTSPVGMRVTVDGDHLAAVPTDRIHVVPSPVTVRLKSANGTTRGGASDSSAGQIEFTLPDGLARPDAPEALEVVVVRGARESAPKTLTL